MLLFACITIVIGDVFLCPPPLYIIGKNAKNLLKTKKKGLNPLFLFVSKLVWLDALWGAFVIK